MNRPTFESTVSVLVKAYLNDTLEHQNCAACAVGNIVAAANNIKMIKVPPFGCSGFTVLTDPQLDSWFSLSSRVFETPQTINTGYEQWELAKIELAFESVYYNGAVNDKIFEGLMNVVNTLAEIHGVNLEVTEKAKLQFVKPC